MTPAEKAEYRSKVQNSFYVDQPVVVDEKVSVTGKTTAPILMTTTTKQKKKPAKRKWTKPTK